MLKKRYILSFIGLWLSGMVCQAQVSPLDKKSTRSEHTKRSTLFPLLMTAAVVGVPLSIVAYWVGRNEGGQDLSLHRNESDQQDHLLGKELVNPAVNQQEKTSKKENILSPKTTSLENKVEYLQKEVAAQKLYTNLQEAIVNVDFKNFVNLLSNPVWGERKNEFFKQLVKISLASQDLRFIQHLGKEHNLHLQETDLVNGEVSTLSLSEAVECVKNGIYFKKNHNRNEFIDAFFTCFYAKELRALFPSFIEKKEVNTELLYGFIRRKAIVPTGYSGGKTICHILKEKKLYTSDIEGAIHTYYPQLVFLRDEQGKIAGLRYNNKKKCIGMGYNHSYRDRMYLASCSVRKESKQIFEVLKEKILTYNPLFPEDLIEEIFFLSRSFLTPSEASTIGKRYYTPSSGLLYDVTWFNKKKKTKKTWYQSSVFSLVDPCFPYEYPLQEKKCKDNYHIAATYTVPMDYKVSDPLGPYEKGVAIKNLSMKLCVAAPVGLDQKPSESTLVVCGLDIENKHGGEQFPDIELLPTAKKDLFKELNDKIKEGYKMLPLQLFISYKGRTKLTFIVGKKRSKKKR